MKHKKGSSLRFSLRISFSRMEVIANNTGVAYRIRMCGWWTPLMVLVPHQQQEQEQDSDIDDGAGMFV